MRSNSEFEISRVAKIKSNKCKLVKSSKPLANFRFYLDIEKHHISLKIETKIKELGGSIEFFLTKEVTHFVTDKVTEKDNLSSVGSPQTPHTPQASAVSHYSDVSFLTPNSSTAACNEGKNKIKSRADAMLHRARKGVIVNLDKQIPTQKDPREIARAWNTPIWTTEYALKFLEKVCASIKARCASNNTDKSKQKVGRAKVLKGDYVKIESLNHFYRPYYQEFKSWPLIDLRAIGNTGAFRILHEEVDLNKQERLQKPDSKQKDNNSTMTRKSRSKHIRVKKSAKISSEKQCGFCEICRVEYDVLTIHLKTDEHLNFAKNDKNFIALDTLIKSGASVDRFLSISSNKNFTNNSCEIFNKRTSKRNSTNKEIPLNQETFDIASNNDINGGEKCALREEMNFTRYTRRSQIKKSSGGPDNLDGSNGVVGIVRARRASVRKINYAEPKEDEENSNDCIIQTPKRKKLNNLRDSWGTPCSELKAKPSTLLYKVVEPSKDDKLKTPAENKESVLRKNEFEKPSPLIVKFKKIRQTELSVLNNEAENFMFPRKFSEISTDVDRQTTSEPCSVSSEIISSDKTDERKSSSSTTSKMKAKPTSAKKEAKSVAESEVDVANIDVKTSKENRKSEAVASECKTSKRLANSVLVKTETNKTENTSENVSDSSKNMGNATVSEKRKVATKEVQLRLNRIECVKTVVTRTMTESKRLSSDTDAVAKKSYKRGKLKTEQEQISENSLPKEKQLFLTAPIQPCGDKSSPARPKVEKVKNEQSSPGDGMGERYTLNIEEALKTTLSEQKFAFERVPANEPWYDVFQRQDECKERMFEYYGSTVYRRLPYEMGPLPPLPPNCCILTQKPNKDKKRDKDVTKENNAPENIVCIPKAESEEKNKPTSSKVSSKKTIKDKNLNKAAALLNLEMPRKSPREHASTLAILSCLIQQKEEKPSVPKVEVVEQPVVKPVTKPVVNQVEVEEEEPCVVVPQISENVKRLKRGETLLKKRLAREECENNIKKSVGPRPYKKKLTKKEKTFEYIEKNLKKDDYVDVNSLGKKIDEYLSQSVGDTSDYNLEMPNYLIESNLCFESDLELADLLHEEKKRDYVMKGYTPAGVNRLRLFNIFSINKKRKNNRTGWPKKKRIIVPRQQQMFKIPHINGLSSSKTINCTNRKTNIKTQPPITPPETDTDEKVGCDDKLISCRDEITNLSCISASDKADNSDIFTVSSDSLDTILDSNSQIKLEPQNDFQSCSSSARTGGSTEQIVTLSKEQDKVLPIFKDQPKTKRKSTYNRKKYSKKTESSGKSSSIRNVTVEAATSIKKDTVFTPSPLSPPSSEMINGNQVVEITMNLKPSPEKCPQLSPRKLRAPRGRWYRER